VAACTIAVHLKDGVVVFTDDGLQFNPRPFGEGALPVADLLREQGIPTAYCRIRALPASEEIAAFVGRYDRVYVVEQNRDGHVYSILRAILEGTLDDRLVSVTHYNGTPIAVENVARPILDWERNFSEHDSLSNGHPAGDENGESEGLSVTTE